MEDQSYNGYTNYETWCINLWIDNDQGLYDMIYSAARRIAVKTSAVREIADMVKELVEEMRPELPASMYSDLLKTAIDRCNFREIAENIIEGIEE